MIDMIFGVWMLFQAASPAAGGKPVEAAQARPAAAEAQDVDRPPISAADLKALRDNNIFSPRTKRLPTKTYNGNRDPKPTPVPVKPKPPIVTGIFFDVKSQAYLVVVEDRNDASHRYFKEPKFLKAGDEVMGIKVESVSSEKAVFLKGDVSKDARVGDPMPETDAKPLSVAAPSEDPDLWDEDDPSSVPAKVQKLSTKTESKTETKPLDSKAQADVLEELKKKNGKMRKGRPGE